MRAGRATYKVSLVKVKTIDQLKREVRRPHFELVAIAELIDELQDQYRRDRGLPRERKRVRRERQERLLRTYQPPATVSRSIDEVLREFAP